MPSSSPADDQGDLAVRLQADEAEDDVDARLLQLAGPEDVPLLVQPGLQLDDRRHLLAVVGRPLQGAGRSASRELVRYSVCLMASTRSSAAAASMNSTTGAERLVRVVDQDVAGPDGRPDAGRGREVGDRLRDELRVAQVRVARQAVHLEQPGQVEQARARGTRRPPCPVPAPTVRNCSSSSWASASISSRTAAPAAALADRLLDRLEQVLDLVVLDLVLAVPRDPEHGGVVDGHAGEQVPQVQPDDRLQRGEARTPCRPGSWTNRGSTAGTWTTANSRSGCSGRSQHHGQVERLVRAGAGTGGRGRWPAGVRTGKISLAEHVAAGAAARRRSGPWSRPDDDALLLQGRQHVLRQARGTAPGPCSPTVWRMRSSCSVGEHPVGRRSRG